VRPVRARVNGRERTEAVPPRLLLCDFLRARLRLTGTHVGCEHGVCGACTVLLDGEPVRSCLLFAAQIDGREVTTVEGLAPDAEHLHPVQQAFHEEHALQCGFCTPGMVMNALDFAKSHPNPSEEEVRESLEGNLCRCTGYHNIVKSIMAGARAMAGSK